MEKIVFWKAAAMVGLMALPIAGRAQSADVAYEETLREVTVNSRSAQKRVDEVQIGVEKVEIATLAKVPSLFGEKDIIKSIQLLPGIKSESEGSGGYQVRGGTAAQNLILLDGATIYNAGHLMGYQYAFGRYEQLSLWGIGGTAIGKGDGRRTYTTRQIVVSGGRQTLVSGPVSGTER